MPVVEIIRAISDPEKPHDRNIAYVTPTATAPPPGTVFATVVEDWLLTAACDSVSRGIAAIIWSQYVKSVNTEAAVSVKICIPLNRVTVSKTDE
jgi:hypothetical protein